MNWSEWKLSRVLINEISYDIKSRHIGGQPKIVVRHAPWKIIRILCSEIEIDTQPDRFLRPKISIIEMLTKDPSMLEMQIGVTPKENDWFGIDYQVSGPIRISVSI